jgi:diguanylate cyclase (GGDEF)-like protein
MKDSNQKTSPADRPEGRDVAQKGDAGPDCLSAVRSTYLNILSELDLDLDPDYVRRLGEVKRAVGECQEVDDLAAIHSGLEFVVRRYSRLMHRERNTHAALTAEVARRLAGLDRDLADWRGKEARSEQGPPTIGPETLEGALARWREEVGQLNNEVRRVEAQSKALAHRLQYDPLTGALTRAAFETRLIQELDRYRRYKRPFVLTLLDVDRFEQINQALGHPLGDACLVELVGRLRLQLRRSDVLARYGGEEFVILLPETNLDQGRVAAIKLHQQVRETDFSIQGRPVSITVSIGLTQVATGDAVVEDVIGRAQRALSRAQQEGGDRVVGL